MVPISLSARFVFVALGLLYSKFSQNPQGRHRFTLILSSCFQVHIDVSFFAHACVNPSSTDRPSVRSDPVHVGQ